MTNNTLAKVFGWMQFVITSFATIQQGVSAQGLHGAFAWLALLGSLGTAIGVHAAAESAPTNPAQGPIPTK